MLISIDKLASRYHKLPSEIMDQASTFDLVVMDIGRRYEHIEDQKRKGTYRPKKPQLTQEQMEAMLKAVKERANGKDQQTKV